MPSNEQFVALGMNSARFKPTKGQADLIRNFVVTGDGTLKSITGPTLYEPRESWATLPVDLGEIHAGWHGYFNGGKKEVLLLHGRNELWCHWGAVRGWVRLNLPRRLHNDTERQSQFIPFNNGVIYCDGFGPPLFVTHQLDVLILGFPEVPSPPVVRGPESPNQDDTDLHSEGALGYSWHGGIGTPGDRLNGENAHILATEVQYKAQFESFQGDLSAQSEVSAVVEYGPKKAKSVNRWLFYDGTSNILSSPGQTINDLRRGVAALNTDAIPDNAKYLRLLRTKDTNRNETDFYVAWKIPVEGGAIHDWRHDAGLTQKAPDVVPIPSFSSGVQYNGALAILDGEKVRLSQPNFPGTFLRNSWVNVTSDGRQGTAIFSLGGRLFAATDRSIVDCTDFASPKTISASLGIESQSAFTYAPGMGIVFVGPQGVYSLNVTGDGTASIAKISQDIDYLWRTEINRTALNTSVLWYSQEHNEVRIAVANKGEAENTRILAVSSDGWREYDLGLEINCAFMIDDMEAIGGNDNRSTTGQYTSNDLFILEREHQLYTPPARNTVYESDWEPLDGGLGAVRGQVLNLMICFAETSAELVGQVDVYLNYENGPSKTLQWYLNDVVGSGMITTPERRAEWANAINNTDVWEQRRVFWRTWKVALQDVQRFKFKITVPYPSEVELVSVLYNFDVPAKVTHREPGAQER